ncbi:MAG TPA: hypothetical protein VF720_01950, partial [Candidatus Eisenbacteria bacterium]
MIRRLGSLVLILTVSTSAARGAVVPTASPFTTPTVSGRHIVMAQIGGSGPRPKDDPEKPLSDVPQVVNPKTAMLYSLLLPGLGQQAAGRGERARVFYAIEAGIWTSFAIFRVQGDQRQDRYIEYAEFTAGVDASGKDDDYWRTLAQYERSDPGPASANEFVRRQARALYPGDIVAQQQYFADNGYFENDTWDWQNSDNLARYQSLRSSSLDSYDKAELSIFAAIANRVVSVIDAARVAGQANREAAESSRSKDSGGGIGNPLNHLG